MSYSLSEVAAAVGISARTLSDWVERKIIPLPRTGKGNPRRFDVRDTDRAALISALVTTGLPVGDAAKAVSVFSDDRSYKRPRAQLHRDGAKTLLIVDGEHASVVRAFDRAEFEDAMSKLYEESPAVVVLNVGAVLRRVDAALDGKGTPKPPAAAIFRHGRQLHHA
jgi:DNA-binding transcriptional MerR regulator